MTGDEQEKILKNYVSRLRTLHEELDDEELRLRFRDWLTICCLIYPTENVNTEIFTAVSDIFAAVFHIDDLADDEEMMQELALTCPAVYRRFDIWEELWSTGNTECYNRIALQFPILKTGLGHLAQSVERVANLLPGLRERLCYPNRALFESAETVPLVTLDLERDGESLSEEGLKFVRGLNAGFQMPLEFITAVEGVELPEEVRSSLLFEIFMNGFNLGSGLFNDIFGLSKDMKKSASSDNCILRKVVREGIPLEQSFQETLLLLRNTTKDTRLAGKKLMETFPKQTSVSKFIRIAEHIFDGQIYSYLLLFKLKGRYGSIDFKVEPQC